MTPFSHKSCHQTASTTRTHYYEKQTSTCSTGDRDGTKCAGGGADHLARRPQPVRRLFGTTMLEDEEQPPEGGGGVRLALPLLVRGAGGGAVPCAAEDHCASRRRSCTLCGGGPLLLRDRKIFRPNFRGFPIVPDDSAEVLGYCPAGDITNTSRGGAPISRGGAPPPGEHHQSSSCREAALW